MGWAVLHYATLLRFHSAMNKATSPTKFLTSPPVVRGPVSWTIYTEIARVYAVRKLSERHPESIWILSVFWRVFHGLSLWNTWDIPVALILSTSRSVQIVSRRAWRDIKISHHGSGTDLHISTPSTLVKHLAIACGTLQSPRAGVA